MRKASILTILIFVIIFVISCDNDGAVSDEQYARKQADAIVGFFDSKGVEELKEIFSESAQEKNNLEEKIQILFNLYEGKSISYEFVYTGTAGEKENGEWIDKNIMPSIYLETDTGKKYNIVFCEYLIYKKDETMLGMDFIILYDISNNSTKFLAIAGGDD